MHVSSPPSMEELALVFHVPIETVRGAQGLMDHEMDYLHDDTPLPPAICDLILGHLVEVWDATEHLPECRVGDPHVKPLAEIMVANVGAGSLTGHWAYFTDHYEIAPRSGGYRLKERT